MTSQSTAPCPPPFFSLERKKKYEKIERATTTVLIGSCAFKCLVTASARSTTVSLRDFLSFFLLSFHFFFPSLFLVIFFSFKGERSLYFSTVSETETFDLLWRQLSSKNCRLHVFLQNGMREIDFNRVCQ